ncbi:GGDEF domain-containing protein [Herbaspirillum sp. GCM10030257]|uniref:GGDEF domain-containing protein n=1 Tax=Herbaspirillum sp. GCM10030257 TaxID=3273393 RepID=UPI00360638D6
MTRPALDIEVGQVLFRLMIASGFGLYLGVMHFALHVYVRPALFILFFGFLCFSLAWVWLVKRSLLRLKLRLAISILVDQSVLAAATLTGGDMIAPVLWGPISVAVGCGLIGGTFYAKAAALLGSLLMAFAFMLSPFWSSVPLVSLGVVLATLIIPWQVALVSEQITQGRKELRQRAIALEAATRTDPLTGVLNRAGFDVSLARMLENTSSDGKISAVMLLDLDGFKAVNDIAGHNAGDEVLKQVAHSLRQSLRTSDDIGRIGGDEFAVLAHNLVAPEDAEWLAYKILHAIETLHIAGHAEIRISGSIGICIHPDPESTSVEELMANADRLMYQAKRSGKNQYRTSFGSALSIREAC